MRGSSRVSLHVEWYLDTRLADSISPGFSIQPYSNVDTRPLQCRRIDYESLFMLYVCAFLDSLMVLITLTHETYDSWWCSQRVARNAPPR